VTHDHDPSKGDDKPNTEKREAKNTTVGSSVLSSKHFSEDRAFETLMKQKIIEKGPCLS
jgi:hypothetical protein